MSEYSYYKLDGRKISFFNTCLFCGSPSKNNRYREHIIPDNIYGFIESYDICDCCGRYFGDKVDDLGIRQPNIIEALENLGYPRIDEYKRNFPYYSDDMATGTKIDMVKDGDRFRPKNVNDIRDPSTIFWLLKKEHSRLPRGQKDEEIDRIARELKVAKPGNITHSEILNKGFITSSLSENLASPHLLDSF